MIVEFPLLLLAPCSSLKKDHGRLVFKSGAKWYTVEVEEVRHLCLFLDAEAARTFCDSFSIDTKGVAPLYVSPERLLAILRDCPAVILNPGSQEQWTQSSVALAKQLQATNTCDFQDRCHKEIRH